MAKAEIIKLGNGDPVSLGTIGGINEKRGGINYDEAKNNSIAAVSKRTARDLVALINSKGIN